MKIEVGMNYSRIEKHIESNLHKRNSTVQKIKIAVTKWPAEVTWTKVFGTNAWSE